LDLINGRRNDRDDAVHSSAVLDHECEVRDSVVGAGARIGKGARVIGSVIGPRAVIGDSAVVEGSVALGDVAASQVVRDALIAPA
ncbi:MAG: hypothetical protein EBV02_07810, partial [Actinobacteria bacterium]|nr:hypothetical protein [Actinomycetota bacterium]